MKRVAIFAATGAGARLAFRLRTAIDAEIIIYTKHGITDDNTDVVRYEKLRPMVEKAFNAFDTLIFIMAAGIAVRMVAPYLKSKLKDPAVLVIDERGNHVISLLSGHIGGANECTLQIAEAIGADPVITTATDTEGILAPDNVAAELALRPVPAAAIRKINSAVLNGIDVEWRIDASMYNADFYSRRLAAVGIYARMSESWAREIGGPIVRITDTPPDVLCDDVLYLVPRRLIAGIGCRKNTSFELLDRAIRSACSAIGRLPGDISAFASTDKKNCEKGMISLARYYGRDLYFYDNEKMQNVIDRYRLEESPFVKKTIGIGNVAEAAALCCADGRFALPKTKYERVTVALLWEK